MPRRFQGPPTAFVVIAVAVVQVVGTAFAAARQPDMRPLDALAFVLLLAGPAALSLRRRSPAVMLPAVAAATLLYLASGYPWGPVLLSWRWPSSSRRPPAGGGRRGRWQGPAPPRWRPTSWSPATTVP